MANPVSVFQLEACVPGALNFALGDAVEAGVESVPPGFAGKTRDERLSYLRIALAADPETREQFLGRLARKSADRLLPPTQLMLDGEAEAGSRLTVVSVLPEPVVEAARDGIEAMSGRSIDQVWGNLAMFNGRLDLSDTLRKIRAGGYSIRTIVRGPEDRRKTVSPIQLEVEWSRGTRPEGTTQISWHPRSETTRVQRPHSKDHFFEEHILHDPVARRVFRELLGYQRPGRVLR